MNYNKNATEERGSGKAVKTIRQHSLAYSDNCWTMQVPYPDTTIRPVLSIYNYYWRLLFLGGLIFSNRSYFCHAPNF